VGGGTPSLEEYKPRTNIGGYTKQVVKGLRYVLKEYRIEEGEGGRGITGGAARKTAKAVGTSVPGEGGGSPRGGRGT
jgi:hypothetical protein